jgi:hypothetical protein
MEKKKKIIIIVVSIILAVALIGGIVAVAIIQMNGNNNGNETTKTSGGKLFSKEPKVTITKNEASTVEYDTYDNSLVSFKYPKGWTVEIAPVDYIHYCFKVYNPKNPDYMLFFGLKHEGFLKTEHAREVYAGYYPDAIFSKLPAIDPQTTKAYYEKWNEIAKYLNDVDFKSMPSFAPTFKNLELGDNLGTVTIGGDILRGTYDGQNGKCQGLFTATVKDIGSYYISENIWNPLGPQVDVWPLNVYNIIFMTAPEEEFINWQPILDNCLASIEFSQTFINGFNQEETTLTQTIIANQKVYDSISDMIMDSWEQRNASTDRISQKQSDATLGYERVYDTDTGEIYKAPNGFMDHYDGTKYEPITDDMYTEPTAGYIE